MTAPSTFQDIAHLVSEKSVQGSTVEVTFRCSDTGVEATSSASVRRSTSIKDTAERSAKSNAVNSVQRTIARFVREIFGSGAAGRVANDVTRAAATGAKQKTQFTGGEVETAVVEAFVKVQDKFQQVEGRWTGSSDAPASATPTDSTSVDVEQNAS